MNQPEFKDAVSYSWGIVYVGRWIAYKRSTYSADFSMAVNHARLWDEMDYEAICYCDGSGTTLEKPAGIGVVVYPFPMDARLIAENIGLGTNNRAELAAIWRALKAIPDARRRICIRTDSEYAIGILTKEWTVAANAELVLAMQADLRLREGRVRFEHVSGHAGVEGNEIADRLANIGRKLITGVSQF